MEPRKIDDFSRALVTAEGLAPSRRSLLSGLAGLAGGLTAFAGLSLLETDAKKKRQAKKHKSKHAAHKHNAPDTDAEKKKKKKKCSKKKRKAGKCGPKPPGGGGGPAPYTGPVFSVSGRNVLDTNGATVKLRGVNKMSVFDDDDPTGANYFPAIANTGANTVRIVWAITDDVGTTDPSQMDALITNCRNNGMLPMIELHDATGQPLSNLQTLANYWMRSDVLTIIFKHSANLLLNIANECGDDDVEFQEWVNAYIPIIQQLRNAGIRVPLVIDGPKWGKSLEAIVDGAAQLLAVDSNLIFSVHTYWPADEASDQFIKDQFDAAVAKNIAVVIGEFSKWGANSICTGTGLIRYITIMDQAASRGFGWYAWEWGNLAGNGNSSGDDPNCGVMDMTQNNVIKPGTWAVDVATRLAAAPAIF